MQATATSNNNNNTIPIINKTKFISIKLGPCDPKRVNNKWPATMLAASRIDKVIGRIILLIVSIITIIGIKNLGVPTGTRWARRLLYWYTIDQIIEPSHKGRAKTKVIDKWLVLVKI